MRVLTLKGFLTQYVRELSQARTLRLKGLADEVAAGNYRLGAPLVLYAAVTEKEEALLRALGASDTADDLRGMLQELSGKAVEEALASGDAPADCLKVWRAFQVAKTAPDRDRELKDAIRKKVLQKMQDSSCSSYRIYTDLKLNPGNVNSWLKNGDSSKVSYRNAERIMNYVMQYNLL